MLSFGTLATFKGDIMKFLCVCQGGNVRSFTLSTLLKLKYNQEAIAVGWQYMDKAAFRALSKWADYIIFMQPWEPGQWIPKEYQNKVRVLDIGEDRWGVSLNIDLVNILDPVIRQWEKREFKL